MTSLIVQIVVTLVARVFTSWREAARVGIASMLLFTGISHFSGLKHDMAAMIPPPFTGTLPLIYFTGMLELVGAAALLTHRWRTPAAWGLIALLFALFPANVFAALAEVPFAGQAATPLWFRTPLQLFWILTLWRVALPGASRECKIYERKNGEWLVRVDGLM